MYDVGQTELTASVQDAEIVRKAEAAEHLVFGPGWGVPGVALNENAMALDDKVYEKARALTQLIWMQDLVFVGQQGGCPCETLIVKEMADIGDVKVLLTWLRLPRGWPRRGGVTTTHYRSTHGTGSKGRQEQ